MSTGYADSRYLTWVFYGRKKTDLLDALEKLALWLMEKSELSDLYHRGVLKSAGLSMKTVRQRRLHPGTLKRCFEGADYEELGIYVFDAGFTKKTAPEVLINLHLSNTSRIGGIPVGDGHVGAFGMIAVSERLGAALADELPARVKAFIRRAEPLALREWKHVPYVYDGKGGLEWAYNNLTSELNKGDLKTLRSQPAS